MFKKSTNIRNLLQKTRYIFMRYRDVFVYELNQSYDSRIYVLIHVSFVSYHVLQLYCSISMCISQITYHKHPDEYFIYNVPEVLRFQAVHSHNLRIK